MSFKCPQCNWVKTAVKDSRTWTSNEALRRRRECTNCGHRFTTYEVFHADEIEHIQQYFQQKLNIAIEEAIEKLKQIQVGGPSC